MKRIILPILLILLNGCSSRDSEVIKYIEPKYPRLEVVEVEVSTIDKFEPNDIEIVDSGSSVKMSVQSLLRIQELMKTCRTDRDVLLRVYHFYHDEIDKYNKEFVDEKK